MASTGVAGSAAVTFEKGESDRGPKAINIQLADGATDAPAEEAPEEDAPAEEMAEV